MLTLCQWVHISSESDQTIKGARTDLSVGFEVGTVMRPLDRQYAERAAGHRVAVVGNKIL